MVVSQGTLACVESFGYTSEGMPVTKFCADLPASHKAEKVATTQLEELTGCHPLDQLVGGVCPPLADNSKDYMLLGCFPDGPGSMQTLLNEDPLPLEAGVSADKCAAMTRAANTSFTSFGVVGSGW
jgi:hypothetical protein